MEPTPPVRPLPECRCPLCGGPNGCAPARVGSFDAPCWCCTVTFSADLLARVPPELAGKACICQTCAQSKA